MRLAWPVPQPSRIPVCLVSLLSLPSSNIFHFGFMDTKSKINLLSRTRRERAEKNSKLLGKRYVHQIFLVPLTTSPLTLAQSIPPSTSSSTSPQITTLSPRIRYKPCSTCELGSGSSGVRIIRSTVCARTRFVSWSVERSVPRRVRSSTVRISTFSGLENSQN